MSATDWDREIDRWTERFRDECDPPQPFAAALRDGWTPEARAELAERAEAYRQRHSAYRDEIRSAGVDLVRFDCKTGSCSVCRKYEGKAYSLTGETPDLPPPPPLPICPACDHTLNLLTPFFLQSLGLDIEDLVEQAQPFVDD
ncbi:MAG: hypothetical protein OEM67_01605 [Thermoleophilia bacterium]|nr:hypothetical protein [Thermoleophilia bacterium]MDH3724553.1 hypothetical protein [Thermoleophilia bacterium]